MTFLLWQREGEMRIASPRRVLRASEVPLLADAQALRDRIEALHNQQAAQVDAARAEARAAGHAQGLGEGRSAARDDIAATLNELAASAARQHDELRHQVAALALQVVRKLMGRFAAPEQLVALADTAAREMLPAQSWVLAVHPDRVDAVREQLNVLAASGEATLEALPFELRPDAACALDACRIETELGSVEASLEAQLQRLAKAWAVERNGAVR
jgi:flagellar biosynthesis/type III secretory pathway protein FliH